MRYDRFGEHDEPASGRVRARAEVRHSNFFHPHDEAQATSRRALRAERRKHRRERKSLRALTVAVVLITVFGLIALVVMAQVLRPLHA